MTIVIKLYTTSKLEDALVGFNYKAIDRSSSFDGEHVFYSIHMLDESSATLFMLRYHDHKVAGIWTEGYYVI